MLETLDDGAPVVLPLQYMPLVQNRRLGAVSYRNFMFATKEAQPRENEEAHDRSAIEKAMMEAELPTLIERRDQFFALQAALSGIAKLCNERLGSAQSISLEKVVALTGKIFAFLNEVISKRDPTAAVAALSTPVSNDLQPAVVSIGVIRSKTM